MARKQATKKTAKKSAAKKQTPAQKKTVDRVMHEFKHGELETGQGRKVKNPRQAIAIALSEAGASNQASKSENKRNLSRTKKKESRGQTAMQEKEGKGAKTRTELYAEARKRDIPGRSKMSKAQLERALRK
jgi:hypothetical protein